MPILVVNDEANVRRDYAAFLASRGIVAHEALVCQIEDGTPDSRRLFVAGKGEFADKVRAHQVTDCEYIDLSEGPEGVLRDVAHGGDHPVSGHGHNGPVNGNALVNGHTAHDRHARNGHLGNNGRGGHEYATGRVNGHVEGYGHATVKAPANAHRPGHGDAPSAGAPVMIGDSPKMRSLHQTIARLGDVDSTVLITGESGAGKETVARQIFRASSHHRREFIPVNCGAIPEGLIETELFGHKRGSFTGAVTDKEGLVERADRGVLFLDEIGDMPPAMQVRLLRFLDSGEFRRVGDPTLRRTDVRVVAATNRPLDRDIAAGRFRLDLFYRLSVVSLHVPPLRERLEDVPTLAQGLFRQMAPRLRTYVQGLSDEAFCALQAYHWPGNVRELQNVIECATIVATNNTIMAEDVRRVLMDRNALRVNGEDAPEEGRDRMKDTLALFGGNQSRAAEALGISRTTLWRRQRRAAADSR